ncbi:hypothetical protein [Bacteriophage sp.]|nr:hypothetical protein [Bacteriophage sp.]
MAGEPDRIIVVMPDGMEIDAPAGTSKEAIYAKWQQHTGAGTGVGRKLAVAGSAAIRGPLQMPALAIDLNHEGGKADAEMAGGLTDAFNQLVWGDKPAPKPFPGALGPNGADPSLPMGASTAVAGIGAQPVTSGEKYLASSIEGVTSALAGPGGAAKPLLTAAAGGGAGVGSEAAAQTLGDSWWARLLGGFAGATPVGLGASLRKNGPQLARETLKDIPELDLRRAQQRMQQVNDSGAGSINFSQAMDIPSEVDSLVNSLASSRFAPNVKAQLNKQPGQVVMAADAAQAGLPGEVRSLQTAANNAQQSASDVVKLEIEEAGKLWRDKAPQGSVLPPEAVAALDARLAKIAKNNPNLEAAKVIEDVRKNALTNPEFRAQTESPLGGGLVSSKIKKPVSEAPNDKFLTDALDLKNAIRDHLDNYGARTNATGTVDANTLRVAQQVRNEFRAVLEKYAPKLLEADAAYSGHISNVVDPLRKSEVGRLAGKVGATDTAEASVAKLVGIFDRGTVPGSKNSEILSMQRALAKTPEGNANFQDAVKSWLASRLSKATEPQAGRTPLTVAQKLEDVFGSPRQSNTKWQGTKDMLVALARSRNLPDGDLLRGFQATMEFITSAAKRPGAVGEAATDIRAVAQGEAPNLLRPSQASMAYGIREKLKSMGQADAYRFIDNLITTPEGVDTLIKLGKTPVMSNKAATLMAAALGATGTRTPNTDGFTGQ